MFLLRVIAHVGEGKNGDCRSIQGRLEVFARWSGALRRTATPGLAFHVADEPDAPARDGADQFLLRGAVADRLAGGVDAAGKGRVRHGPAVPDRGEKIALADDALAGLQKVGQDGADL